MVRFALMVITPPRRNDPALHAACGIGPVGVHNGQFQSLSEPDRNESPLPIRPPGILTFEGRAAEDQAGEGKKVNRMKVTRDSGNVFRDVGFSPQAADSLRYRADLMIALTDLIRKRRWTQAAAAKAMGVTQLRISDLKRGKLARFSLDKLVQMLGRAGAEVRVSGVTRGLHCSKKQAA